MCGPGWLRPGPIAVDMADLSLPHPVSLVLSQKPPFAEADSLLAGAPSVSSSSSRNGSGSLGFSSAVGQRSKVTSHPQGVPPLYPWFSVLPTKHVQWKKIQNRGSGTINKYQVKEEKNRKCETRGGLKTILKHERTSQA